MIVRVTGPDNIRPVLYQWDVGQVIYIDGVSDAATVNFEMPNMDRALVVHVETSGDRHIAKVPNFTLQYAGWIVVSVFEQDGDVGTTVCREKLLIKPRQKPQDYTYEENIGYTNWVTKSAEAEELLSDLTDEWEQLKEDIESGHYKGDKGETGQTGATGPQGPPGPQGLPGTTTWSGITDKPTAFTPSTHQHTQNDVSGLVAALANKSDNNHNHTAEEVSFDTEAEYQDGTVGSGLTTAFGEIAKLANTTTEPATAGQVLTATYSGAEYADLPKVKINGTETTDNNIPYAGGGVVGLVSASNYDSATGINIVMENGRPQVTLNPAPENRINNRTGNMAITPPNLVKAVDSVLCSTTASEALSADQQANACARLGAVPVNRPWTTIATLTKDNPSASTNLTGKTEILIVTNTVATGIVHLYSTVNGARRSFLNNVCRNGTVKGYAIYKDELFGFDSHGRYNTTDAGITSTDFYPQASIDGSHIANITKIEYNSTTSITSGSTIIYAR